MGSEIFETSFAEGIIVYKSINKTQSVEDGEAKLHRRPTGAAPCN